MANLIGPYRALALQTRCDAINSIADVALCRAQMMASIARIHRQIAASKAFVGDDLKLVVLPEYFLTSFPVGPDLPTWAARACLHANGPEYVALGEVAKKNGVYLSGNAYEIDPKFPDLSFQISFIINDSGERILAPNPKPQTPASYLLLTVKLYVMHEDRLRSVSLELEYRCGVIVYVAF